MKRESFITILYFLFFAPALLYYSCEDSTSPSHSGETIYDQYPTWSPSGNSIAYTGGTNSQDYGIYAIDTHGTDKQNIAVPEFAAYPDWSPDGQWIAYTKAGNIFKKLIDDSTIVQLTFTGNNSFPSWSHDGKWISFDSDNESPNGMNFVWKMRSDGSEKKRIIYLPTTGEVRQPDWFPDGIKLAVIRYGRASGFPDIAVIDTMGNLVSVLTNDDVFNQSPKVSRDGQYIVYWRYGGQICAIKTNGTNQFVISENSISPNWSPDSKMITFTNTSPGDGRIWIMKIDGSARKKLSF